jgi:hypothetical protein
MIAALSLQYIRIPAVDFAQIFITVTLRKEVTLLKKYRRSLFLDIL